MVSFALAAVSIILKHRHIAFNLIYFLSLSRQDNFPSITVFPVCQEREVSSPNLQIQERMDCIQVTAFQNVPCE